MSTSLRALLLTIALVLAACGGTGGSNGGGTGGSTGGAGGSASPGAAASGLETLLTRPQGAVEEARVVRIVDGDTIVVDRGRGKEKVRYTGIDTPESVKPDTPVAFMGKEATAANAALVEGRNVLLEIDVSDTDQYGRLLRYVWVEDAAQPDGLLLVNLALVARGFAQVATFPPDVRYVDAFRRAERAARDQELGLWGPATPPP